jgi:hypothetical protein
MNNQVDITTISDREIMKLVYEQTQQLQQLQQNLQLLNIEWEKRVKETECKPNEKIEL